MAAHQHGFHELVIILDGRMNLTVDGETTTTRPGDVLFYPKGLIHEERSVPQSPVETRFISFTEEDATPPPGIPLLTRDRHGRIRHLATWLYAERDLCAFADHQTPRAFLQAILAELHRAATQVDAPLIESIRRLIEERLTEPLTLDDLASHVSMSKFHFLRKYKEAAGLTPMHDLARIRVERARDLALTTDLPLKAIAPYVGVANEYQLSRLFRRHLGLTLSQLRNRTAI
jgi:AraC-like DNA-binding protein